jgi:hypothetical protein
MSDGVVTEVLCTDCEGGPERCARDGHVRTWRVPNEDPNFAIFACGRCNQTFKVPRCSTCGAVIGGDPTVRCDQHAPDA